MFYRERYANISNQLPLEAVNMGWKLTWEEPVMDPDPVYLKDSNGSVLKEWHYIPSLTEVFDACKKLMGKV